VACPQLLLLLLLLVLGPLPLQHQNWALLELHLSLLLCHLLLQPLPVL
jgi:hypothetical protein